jgi:UDP-glucose 4-epimerase
MKSLVTGGCGFIGSHLVEALAEEGHEVRVLDSLIKGKKESIQYLLDDGRAELIEGDIKNTDTVDRAVRGTDYVFHTAGIHVIKSAKSPGDCIQNNIQGSYNVFRAAANHGVKRLIFSSSSSIYGDPIELHMKENGLINLKNDPYGSSKLICEHLLETLATSEGLQYNALRYFNVYGSRQAAHAYYTTVVTAFVKNLINDKAPRIDGKGEQSMDFTHVSDVVRANIAAMKSDAHNDIFNVGTGVSTSVRDLAYIIIDEFRKNVDPIFTDREVLVNQRQACTEKAKELLGFEAQVDVRSGLAQIAREIAENPEKY